MLEELPLATFMQRVARADPARWANPRRAPLRAWGPLPTPNGRFRPYRRGARLDTLHAMCTDQLATAQSEPGIATMLAERAQIEYASVSPAGVQAMVGLQRAVDAARLEPLLLELAKMRASQITGCARGLDAQSKDARALGESEQRLHLLAAWRDGPATTREQAALAWCEQVELIAEEGALGAVYEKPEESFSLDEIVALALAIVHSSAHIEPPRRQPSRSGSPEQTPPGR
jgi:AhpD family alkylhydroperoxidase